MTVPPQRRNVATRVSDLVRSLMPRVRNRIAKHEKDLAVYLRGNEDLYNNLRELIEARIRVRAQLPPPSDPIQCKSLLERDRELRTLLERLEFIYSSPMLEAADSDDEHP